MQAVFRLVKNLVGMRFKYVGGNLLAAVRGQTMLHHAAGVRGGKQRFIDLVHALEHPPARGGLVLLPHRRPNVGENNIRAGRRLERVPVKLKALIGVRKIQNLPVGVVPLGARDRDAHAGL